MGRWGSVEVGKVFVRKGDDHTHEPKPLQMAGRVGGEGVSHKSGGVVALHESFMMNN